MRNRLLRLTAIAALLIYACQKETEIIDIPANPTNPKDTIDPVDTVVVKTVYEMVLGSWIGTTANVYVVIPATGEDTTLDKSIANHNVKYLEDGQMLFNNSSFTWKLEGDTVILVSDGGSWVDFPYYIMDINDSMLTTQSRQVFQQQGQEMHEIITNYYVRP